MAAFPAAARDAGQRKEDQQIGGQDDAQSRALTPSNCIPTMSAG